MVVGNDSDGVTKLWITSKLFASTIIVPLDGLNISSISSAYSEQSSKSRELTVESFYINNVTSRHHIFVPLESAVLVATFAYNGSEVLMVNEAQASGQTSPIQVWSLSTVCRSMSRCASLGVYKIGTALYTLCASSSEVCICELRMLDDSDGQMSSANCRLIDHPDDGVIHVNVHEISNIVIYQPHRFIGQLMFFLNNYVYQTTPAHRADDHIYIQLRYCLAVAHLQRVASKLLIYCTNNSYVLEYDIDSGDFVPPQFNNHLYFPCSESMDFSVNLINTEISYRTNEVPSQPSGLRIGRFKFGECITHQNRHLFLYVNTHLHVVNSNTFALYNLTEGTPSAILCMNNEYTRPVFIGERYIIAYDLGCQTTSVFDLQSIDSPIITQSDRPLLLATVIFNISAIISIDPTIATTDSAPPPEEFIIAPPIIVAVVILFYSIFNIIIFIVIWKRY